jgi:hypothetical protein
MLAMAHDTIILCTHGTVKVNNAKPDAIETASFTGHDFKMMRRQ